MQHSSHELPAVQLGVHVRVHHLEVVEQQLVCRHLTRVQGDLHVLLNMPRNETHVDNIRDAIISSLSLRCDVIMKKLMLRMMLVWIMELL